MAGQLLWEGTAQSLTAKATKGAVVGERYRITDEYVYVERGVLTSSAEQYPLWAVRDIDVTSSVVQKARGLADLRIRLEANDYTGAPNIALKDITGAAELRDLLNRHAELARQLRHQQLQTVHYAAHTGAPAAAASSPQTVDPLDQLRKLGDLLSAGLLTQEEFDSQKATLLGSSPSPAPGAPAAGWHSDPHSRHEMRYWDGSVWTEHVSDQGIPGTDPC